jgi:hypothetical protein
MMKKLPKMESVKSIGSFSGTPVKDDENIYLITSVESDESVSWGCSKRRCWGWVATEKEAKYAVSINASDMQETTYDYVVIEKQPSGIPAIAEVVAWYKWTGRYPSGWVWKRCKAPDWSKGTCNWGI